MRKVRQFSREFKLSILNELETKRLCEVCRSHDLAPSTVRGWITDYQKNPKEAFRGRGNTYKEEAKIVEYERLIGRLYAKIDLLERAYEAMKEQVTEEQKKRKLNIK